MPPAILGCQRVWQEDSSGTISKTELVNTVRHYHLPIPDSHVVQLIDTLCDADGDGKVDYNEFTNALKGFDVKWVEPKFSRLKKGVEGARR